MAVLQYRIVTNWPANMQEDFVFAPTEDRNAHYEMVVEILSCIADESNPEQFRLCEQTTYEYDVKMPVEPSIPRMPMPSGKLGDDAAFIELCQRYIYDDDLRFSSAQSRIRDVHIAQTETYVLEGRQLADIAALAKRNRSEAKFRFILGKYGIAENDVKRTSLDRELQNLMKGEKAFGIADSVGNAKKGEKAATAKKAKGTAKGKKSKKAKKEKKAEKKSGKKSGDSKKGAKGKKAKSRFGGKAAHKGKSK